jgi:hypothetical protein
VFEYKMVQVPATLTVSEAEGVQGKAAVYLQEVVGRHAVDGWEFFRVDTFHIQINAGCLAALLSPLLGGGSRTVTRNVVTFRRPRA